MQNDAFEVVDLYIPRKCSATNNLIAAKDHGSVQLGVAELDCEGMNELLKIIGCHLDACLF